MTGPLRSGRLLGMACELAQNLTVAAKTVLLFLNGDLKWFYLYEGVVNETLCLHRELFKASRIPNKNCRLLHRLLLKAGDSALTVECATIY